MRTSVLYFRVPGSAVLRADLERPITIRRPSPVGVVFHARGRHDKSFGEEELARAVYKQHPLEVFHALRRGECVYGPDEQTILEQTS